MGFAVAAVLYLLTYRLPPLWHRVPAELPEQAAAGESMAAETGAPAADQHVPAKP